MAAAGERSDQQAWEAARYGRKKQVSEDGPLFSGRGAPSLLLVVSAAGGRVLPATCARWAWRRGGDRRRWRVGGEPAVVGFPPLRRPPSECLEVDANSGPLGSPRARGQGRLPSRGWPPPALPRRPGLEEGQPRRGPVWREGGDGVQGPARGGSAAPAALQLAAPPLRGRGGRRRPSIGRASRPIPEGPEEAVGGSSCGTPEPTGRLCGTSSD